jgi:ATP-dependent DNA helicase PIF1
MDLEKLSFEAEHISALNIMENTKKSMYLTGKAGAGKSTLVNFFISKTKKSFVLLGTTGVAAQNIWGQTIHSFFWFFPGRKTMMKSEKAKIIQETDIFLIDEASMLRADDFDKLNFTMQKVCKNEEFFGGKQFIFIGDLFQLPPVPEKDEELKAYYQEKYKWLFFFDWNSFLKEHFEIVELKKVYRQDDPKFINMLNRVRIGDKSQDVLDFFNSRVVWKDQINPKSILIATTNAIVDKKNTEELKKIPSPEYKSFARIKGEYSSESYPAERVLTLKIGARVMFTVNDNQTFQYVNGTLGTISNIQMSGDFVQKVIVVLDEGWEIEVTKKTWEHTDWEDEFWEPIVIGTFTQFPFKLAFAITIHKVQGKSFDHCVIDLGWGAFAEGQTYVALSRCRSFSWLQLLKPIKEKDIKVSYDVIKFLRK